MSLAILPPGTLNGQTDRAGIARDSAFPFPSDGRAIEPIRPWPHPVAPPGTFGLPQLAEAAGMVFSGTVTAVTHRPATGQTSSGQASSGQVIETVAITFHVENAIRGATPGEDLTVTQWIGLWSGGQRYRVGERALLFLYPPSKLGLTSCVGGPIGRFRLDPLGRVLLSAQQISAFLRDPVLGGKSRVSFRDFALAVRQASGEE
jgi:hypothetical protein